MCNTTPVVVHVKERLYKRMYSVYQKHSTKRSQSNIWEVNYDSFLVESSSNAMYEADGSINGSPLNVTWAAINR